MTRIITALRCPHCTNDDPRLLERIGKTVGAAPRHDVEVWRCDVCSKFWTAWEPPTSQPTMEVR